MQNDAKCKKKQKEAKRSKKKQKEAKSKNFMFHCVASAGAPVYCPNWPRPRGCLLSIFRGCCFCTTKGCQNCVVESQQPWDFVYVSYILNFAMSCYAFVVVDHKRLCIAQENNQQIEQLT